MYYNKNISRFQIAKKLGTSPQTIYRRFIKLNIKIILKQTLKERVFSKININNKTGCWEWQGWTNQRGCARIRSGNKNHTVSRLVANWVLDFDLNSNLYVCHHCDNPSCINPDHLFIGTQFDNMQDMCLKERQGSGWGMKLNKEKVIEIRDLLDNDIFTYFQNTNLLILV